MIGSKHLIAPDYVETRPGQAHFVVPGATRTCRECLFWDGRAGLRRDSWGALRPAACLKARELSNGEKLRHVPPHALECKYFELNKLPPEKIDRRVAWR